MAQFNTSCYGTIFTHHCMFDTLRWVRCSAGVEVVVLRVLLQQLHGVLHPGHAGLLLAAGPDLRLVLEKVASELHPKVRNHGEGPY